jgi:hypothetical protein
MAKRMPKDSSKWPSKGAGLHKHAVSGVAHNHRVTIEMNREAAREMEKEAKRREENRKKGLTPRVRDLFKDL